MEQRSSGFIFITTTDINPAIVIIDLLPLLPCPLSLIPLLLILLSLIEILYLLLPSQSPTITSIVAAAAYPQYLWYFQFR